MEKKKNTAKSSKKSTTKNAAKRNNTSKKATVKNTNNKVSKNITEVKETVKTIEKPQEVKIKAAKKSSLIDKCKGLWAKNKELVIAICITILLIAVIVGMAFYKRVPKLKNGSSVVASVKGLKVNAEELYEDLSDSYGLDNVTNKIDEYIASKEVTKLTKKNEEYIDQVVDYYKQYAEYYGTSFEQFLSSYVGISGIKTEKQFREYVAKDYKKTLAVQKYVGNKLTDKEINDYYNDNYSEKLTIRVILVEPDKDAEDKDKAKKEALETAKGLIKRLDKYKEDSKKLVEKFEDYAYDNSADSSYKDGGKKKDIMKKDVDSAVWKAASKLKNGEYTSEPVESEYGYYIILRESSKKKQSLKSIKDEVINACAEAKLKEDTTLNATAWDKLRSKYNFKINNSNMKKAYNQKLKDAQKTDSKESNSTETTETNTKKED